MTLGTHHLTQEGPLEAIQAYKKDLAACKASKGKQRARTEDLEAPLDSYKLVDDFPDGWDDD